MQKSRVAHAVAVFASVVACGAPRIAFALEGGAEDATTTSSVSIATGGPLKPSVRCSGTLIAPNVVLTVRHCVSKTESTTSCDASFGATLGDPSEYWINATPWSLPSDTAWKNVLSWTLPQPSLVCGNDIALLVLKTPLTAAEATPAVPVTNEAAFKRAASGRLLGLAAFGASSAAGNDAGTRRSRFDIPIRCLPGDPSFSCGSELEYIDVREFTAGGGPCFGDSGAGALLPAERGTVFGVLSRGNLEGGKCAEGIFERTDIWAWLIARTVLDASKDPSQAPAWAQALFPPSPKVGEFCRGAGTCGGGAECVSLDGARSFVCADRCSGGATCKDGFHCESEICVPGAEPERASSGCASASRHEHGAFEPIALGLVALAVAAARRRRARAQ